MAKKRRQSSDKQAKFKQVVTESLQDFFHNEDVVRPGDRIVTFAETPEALAKQHRAMEQAQAAAGYAGEGQVFKVPCLVMGPNGPEIEIVEVRAYRVR